MSRYRTSLRALSAGTAHRVGDLWRAVEAGTLSTDQFRGLAAAVVAGTNRRAVGLADLALAAALIAALRRPVLPLGMAPLAWQVDQARIATALGTVIAADVDVADEAALAASRGLRLARLAGNEPLVTATGAMRHGMTERQDLIAGWVRETSTQPCPLCVSWADGQVRPPWALMARHVSCSCVQQVVAA